jgi:hypothetical protein
MGFSTPNLRLVSYLASVEDCESFPWRAASRHGNASKLLQPPSAAARVAICAFRRGSLIACCCPQHRPTRYSVMLSIPAPRLIESRLGCWPSDRWCRLGAHDGSQLEPTMESLGSLPPEAKQRSFTISAPDFPGDRGASTRKLTACQLISRVFITWSIPLSAPSAHAFELLVEQPIFLVNLLS